VIDTILWSTILAISVLVLVQGSRYFTVAAERIGLRLGLAPYVIGVAIVATGTSLPELVSSVISAARGASEIAVGNVVGSNITNICLILGLAAVAAGRLPLDHDKREGALTLLLGSALLIALMLYDRTFRMLEAVICLLGLAVFLIYNLERKTEPPLIVCPTLDEEPCVIPRPAPLRWTTWMFLVGGGVGVYLGADFVVRAVSNIADAAGVGKDIIAATAVALGTSLPELAVSIVALRSGRTEISVGNILGSNVFNSFAVLGISALFGPLAVSAQVVRVGIPFMLAATVLAAFALLRGTMERWGGAIFLLLYALFVAASFVR